MQVNHRNRIITAKIVYYGPALGGKTTNLEAIHRFTDPEQKSTLLSLKTEGDRTLFFDLLPFELGSLMGFRFAFKLYTVPGQIKYTATRKKVLEGVDAVVFVADAQRSRAEENRQSLADFRGNLKANRVNPDSIPLILQYNKQDLPDLMTTNELNADLNGRGVPSFNSIAIRGKGILETLAAIIKQTIKAATESNGNHFQHLAEDDLNRTVDRIFAPFYERAKQQSGEIRPVSTRFKEVRLSSRGVDESLDSDGPIREDLVLDPIDLLSRSVQSNLVMAEEASQVREAEQRIGKMRKDLAVLAKLSAKAGEGSDFDRVLTQTLDLAIENTGVDCGSLLLVNNNSKKMGERILRNLDYDPLDATEIKGVGSLAYLLAQRKEAVLTNNVEDVLTGSNPSKELERFHGLASYPLVARNLALGLINLYTTRPGKKFGDDEELFLAILSNFLGLYLLNSFYALKQKTNSPKK
jgi:signal recognition particle receptor subunit beta